MKVVKNANGELILVNDFVSVKSSYEWKIVFFVWLFLGGIGGHRFYVGKTGTGFLYLCTLGLG